MKNINKKLLVTTLICLGLVSCKQNIISSDSLSSSTSNIVSTSLSTSSSSDKISSTSSIVNNFTTSTSSSLLNSSTTSTTSSKNDDMSISSTISSSSTNKESSSTSTKTSIPTPAISSKLETYNPDGTVKLPIPTTSINTIWGQKGQFFEINNSLPEGFSCIYGKQIIDTPPYYATGNFKITYPNSGTRLGFQSPLFEEDLKLEVWFTVDEIHRNNDTLDKTNPWIRIYGFSKNGELITTKEIESPSNFTEREYHYAFNGEGVNYFELRFMSQPYEGSKCYNFGISQIGVKSFPYPYND